MCVKCETQPNKQCVDVEVTGLSEQQKHEIKQTYMSKEKGFIGFSTSWENQRTPQEKMFYTFWYVTSESPVRN